MVVLLLSTMTPDGCCGGDEEGRRWWPYFFPWLPLFFSVSALLPSLCPCYVLFLFRIVFSLLMVVVLLSTMTPDSYCGGDEEGRRWWPCFFFPYLPLFFFLFLLFFLLFVSATFLFCFGLLPTLLSVFMIKLFFFTSFFPILLVRLFSLPVCFLFYKVVTHVKSKSIVHIICYYYYIVFSHITIHNTR